MARLVTERLLLRRARFEDSADMHQVLSDPLAMTYWSTAPHRHISETEDWIRSMIESPLDLSDDFVVEFQGRVVGKIGAWRLPEFGFILTPPLWGKGLASEALTAFLGHVLQRPDVDRLIADVDPRNHASLNLLERHGFVRTGYARNSWHTHIGACDSVYLELDKARWTRG